MPGNPAGCAVVGLLAALSCGCQAVAGFESFEVSASDAGAKPHPCDVLPRTKADDKELTAMVLVRHPSGACSWMDRTEVTVSQYARWLADTEWKPSFDKTACAWKSERSNPMADGDTCVATIAGSQIPALQPDKPIRCVDYCDAGAFCAWAGKRLCHVTYTTVGTNEPEGTPDEWGFGCVGAAQSLYPTGDTVTDTECRIGGTCGGAAGVRVCGPAPVGTMKPCVSESGAVDMIGNVREWVWSCTARDRTATSTCVTRGGAYDDVPGSTACRLRSTPVARNAREPQTGFRCCADLTVQETTMIKP